MHYDTNLMACLEKGQRHRESKSHGAAVTLRTAIFAFWFSFLLLRVRVMKSSATALQGLCSHTLVFLPLIFINTSLFPPSTVFAHLSPATSPKLHHFPSALNLPPFLFPSLIIPLLPKGCRELEHNFLPQKHRLGKALSFRGSSIRTPSTFRALQLFAAVNCLSLLFVHCCAERASWWS